MATWASGKIGFNFRDTLAYYDPDGDKEVFVEGYFTYDAVVYPTVITTHDTTTDVTLGWPSNNAYGRDKSTSYGAHFAGMNYVSAGVVQIFTVDVPVAGIYKLHLALGTATENWSAQSQYVSISGDNGSNWTDILSNKTPGPNANEYYDAGGTLRTSDTDWTTNNTEINVTIDANKKFKLRLGNVAGGYVPVAHMTLEPPTGSESASISASPSAPSASLSASESLSPSASESLSPSASPSAPSASFSASESLSPSASESRSASASAAPELSASIFGGLIIRG